MKVYKRISGIFCFCLCICKVDAQTSLKLWYDKPAAVWTEALPLGNGRIGVMDFGGIQEALFQLNEGTLWSGSRAEPSAYWAGRYLLSIGIPGIAYAYKVRFGFRKAP